MDRNTLFGLLIVFAIFFTWQTFIGPPDDTNEQTAKEQFANADKDLQNHINNKTAHKLEVGSLLGIENKFLKVDFSQIGAQPYKIQLKGQKRFDGSPLILIDQNKYPASQFKVLLNLGDRQIDTKNLTFIPKHHDDKNLVLRHYFNNTSYVDFIYSLDGENYKINFSLTLKGVQLSSPPVVVFENSTIQQEANKDYEKSFTTIYYKAKDASPDYLSETKEKDSKHIDNGAVSWVSFKQRFFSLALVNKTDYFQNLKMEETSLNVSNEVIKHMKLLAQLPMQYDADKTYDFWFYCGPNYYQTLASFNVELEQQIPLGWGPLRWVNKWGVIPFFNFLDNYHLNYGIIIILLTLVVKLVLLPLTYSSHISQVKMQVLKPEIDAIKQKYGDNQQKIQQEYLKLYKTAGVNPFGGCIPLLLQLPVILALFKFLPSAIELRQKSFLWVTDLSTYDAVIKLGVNIPFIGDHISLMCLLMTLSTLLYTWLNNRITGVAGQMKMLGYIMPFLFLGILNSFPAGLNLYYLCSNVITFIQQSIIRVFIDENAIRAKIQQNKMKPVKNTKSKFQQKLEELSRQNK